MKVNYRVLIALSVAFFHSGHEQVSFANSSNEMEVREVAENDQPLFRLLKDTAEQILNTKDLFDYVVVENAYDPTSPHQKFVYVKANNKTVALYKNFWKTLNSLKSKQGDIVIRNTKPKVSIWDKKESIYSQFEYIHIKLKNSNLENPRSLTEDISDSDYVSSLIKNISQAFDNNIENSIATIFQTEPKKISISLTNYSRVGSLLCGVNMTGTAYHLPALNIKPSDGDILYGAIVKIPHYHYIMLDIKGNAKKLGLNVKFKKISETLLENPRYKTYFNLEFL